MKKIIFLSVFLTVVNSYAQYSQVGWLSKFGIAVGFTPAYVNVDADLNKYLAEFGVPGFSNSGMITYGGGGYAYLMLVDNLRIGGAGYGGSKSSSAVVDGLNREAKLSLGGGAITFEYTIPSIKRIAVSGGVSIGWGSMDIELYKKSPSIDWGNVWSQFGNPDDSRGNVYSKMTNSFWSASPTINVDIPFTRFFAARIGGGYTFTFADSWKLNNNVTLNDVPSNVTANNWFIQTGIYIGFFGF